MSGSSWARTWPARTREWKSAKMYLTGPDTDGPTGTVVSGLIVPVASTAAVIVTRLTGEVTNLTAPEWFRKTSPAVATRTTTIASPVRSFRRGVMYPREVGLASDTAG